ncbi:sulfotransferase family protein [Novosphingobium mangrovi (ex Huang et al. 2023)]|uniref:Sulfotransferase family protein n=1 Tax=Novosphingobium mangrovi (ex Huang et al. 2023) TaxID=2976432 RepID=A0ABT2I865_9SPHN|nr:sulfotransferase family protein [Novosphingobium mangrovi (ex Huang et al. 2023)]MCT2401012.1 sulfotransferase family protein [Novosphingobium mangrovi (ex Huang et al. 2023)]
MRWLRNLAGGKRWLNDRHSGTIIDFADWQYFAIPKVACSSIMAALVGVIGVEFPEDEWAPELFQTHKWDHLYDRRHRVITKRAALALADRWRFAFVRNPFDRLVSCYSEKIRPDGDSENFVNGISKVLEPFGVFHAEMSFEEFALAAIAIPDIDADPHWRSQYTFLIDGRGRMAVDFIGRFERLSEDFEIVRKRIGSDVSLPHLLKSERSSCRDYYSSDLTERVRQRYERDLSTFDYGF